MTSLRERVELSLREHGLLARPGNLLVAVSGGVDSMVLLRILHALSASRGWKLAVAHFNHHLRGRSSDADERLVRRTAAALKLPVTVGQGEVKAFAKKSGLSPEMAARRRRHEFLAETARQGKFSTIALGHHADDQVELFFLRLLRGAGGAGLAGMKRISPSPMDKRIALVRPLLDISKAELEQFADAEKIEWREDATNASLDLPRNRVRNELLPLLRKYYQPGLTSTVLRVMEIAGAESALAADWAERWTENGSGPPPAASFDSLPLAVQRRVILAQLQGLGVPADFEWVEQLRGAADTPVNVTRNLFAVRDSAGKVALSVKREIPAFDTREWELDLAPAAGELEVGGAAIHWERAALGKAARPVKARAGQDVFDAARIGGKVILRRWRPGDRFQPLGMTAPVKLQDLFTNAKIPREVRRSLLVASANGEIFWVEGLRVAERFKVTAETRQGLLWKWRRGRAG